MDRLDSACSKLLELKEISGKNAKVAFLDKHKDDKDFMKLLEYRYDIFRTYGIKALGIISYAEEPTLTFDEYIAGLDVLASSNINETLRAQTMKLLGSGNYIYSDVLEGIITKGLSLGVDTTVKKLLNLTDIEVMLASPMDEKAEPPMPCIVEKKEDGVRCVALIENSKCKMYTRQGRQLHFPQLEAEAIEFAGSEDMTFDMELEMEARTGISGVCNSNLKKGYTKGADNFIKMKIFDEIPTAIFKAKGKSLPQAQRTLNLQKRFANFTKAKRISLCESQTVNTLEKLKAINNKYIADGDEGVIVKDPNAIYHYKRNKAWLKMKAINSTTLKVVATLEGQGKRAGMVGTLVCESECGGIKVGVGSGLTDEDIKFYTDNSPIGKHIEVLFNVLIKASGSDTYSLFLPRYKEMRIDKEKADTLAKVKAEHIGKIEE